MKLLFVDTSGWMMLTDRKDPRHAEALRDRDQWLKEGGVLMTTDYVMDETLTLLRVRMGLDVADDWWHRVGVSPRIVWEPIHAARQEAAREMFFKWKDKPFSFTDCTSFVVMKERHTSVALTSDADFGLAGFRRLPG